MQNDTKHTVKITSASIERMLASGDDRLVAELAEEGITGPTWTGDVDFADDEKLTAREIDRYPVQEQAFSYFNRVANSDVERLEDLGYNLPSLSVGDVVEIDGKAWRVAGVGFEEIPDEEVEETISSSVTKAAPDPDRLGGPNEELALRVGDFAEIRRHAERHEAEGNHTHAAELYLRADEAEREQERAEVDAMEPGPERLARRLELGRAQEPGERLARQARNRRVDDKVAGELEGLDLEAAVRTAEHEASLEAGADPLAEAIARGPEKISPEQERQLLRVLELAREVAPVRCSEIDRVHGAGVSELLIRQAGATAWIPSEGPDNGVEYLVPNDVYRNGLLAWSAAVVKARVELAQDPHPTTEDDVLHVAEGLFEAELAAVVTSDYSAEEKLRGRIRKAARDVLVDVLIDLDEHELEALSELKPEEPIDVALAPLVEEQLELERERDREQEDLDEAGDLAYRMEAGK